MRTMTVSRTLCLGTSVLCLVATSAGCDREAAEQDLSEAVAAEMTKALAEPAAAAPAAQEPTGPVFRTKMMGMEMVRPLAAKTLTVEGLRGMTIQAPDSATVSEERGNNHVIDAGVNYSISIGTGAFDPAGAKQVFNILDEAGTVVVDQPDLVIYQRSGANGSVLFGAGVTVGEAQFHCGTVATAFPFTREQVDQMVESCRSLRAAN